MEQYDYIIVNDVLEDAVDTVHNIIQSEKKRTLRNSPFIHRIQDELQAFSKGEN
jgi:guanylate kinase